MHVLFDFIFQILVQAKFAYGIRSINFYRQFRFFSLNKGNNKITELRTILQRESQNS